MSITETTIDLLKDKLFILECLYLNLINHSALADYLKPEIERIMQKSVKPLSISMAIRRHIAEFKRNPMHQISIDPSTDLMTKSNLIEFTIKKTESTEEALKRINRLIEDDNGEVLSVIQGSKNIVILINNRYRHFVEQLINPRLIGVIKEDLGAIFMGIPSKYRDQPGFFFKLTRELAFHNINLLSISNIDTEVLFVFYNNDVPRAFQILYNLIN